MKRDIVWFDLDGTLVDASDRMYDLFQILVPESLFSKSEYWELKRKKCNHKMILNKYFPERCFETFNLMWMDLIESERFLELDKLYPYVPDMLKFASERYMIMLLTARQSKEMLYQELERLDVIEFFEHIFVTEGRKDKRELIGAYYRDLNQKSKIRDFFASDMGKDIMIGNSLGCNTIGVTYGFMSKECMQKYSPTFIVDSVIELKKLLGDKVKD